MGLLGGSGNGGLHLHFETFFRGNAIDPNLVGDQFWSQHIPYSGEHLNVMGLEMTNYKPWDTHKQESWSNFGRLAEFSQTAAKTPVFYKKVTGLSVDDEIYWRFYRPNGDLYASWQTGLLDDLITTPHTFWAFTPVMPSQPEFGDWVIAVEVNGVEMARQVMPVVEGEVAALRVEDQDGLFLHPLRYRPMAIDDHHEFQLTNHGTGSLSLSGNSSSLTDSSWSQMSRMRLQLGNQRPFV